MRRFFAVMRKEFRHMVRDPWVLIVMTVGAAVLMVLMAYTFSADIEHVPVVVMDGDRSPRSRAYLRRFANDPFFDLRYWARSHAEAREWVRSGQARAAIIVSPGFAEAIWGGKQAPVQIVVDGTDPNTAQQVLGNVEALSANFSVELLHQRLVRAGLASERESLPLQFRVRALYNPDLKEVYSVLPGLMAIVLAMPALSAALSLAREREQGSLEGLMATPIRRCQLLAGKVIPYLLVGLVDVFLFTLVGMITFGVPFRGSLADLVLASSLFLLANLGIGLLISSLVRTQMAALLIAGLIFVMPPINESGIFHPLYAMPPDARMQAMLWPATHYVAIARGIFLKGVGMRAFVVDTLFLLFLGLLLNGLAVWRLRKRLA
jgi:ABC-type multidrug transport system permease subunit